MVCLQGGRYYAQIGAAAGLCHYGTTLDSAVPKSRSANFQGAEGKTNSSTPHPKAMGWTPPTYRRVRFY